MEISFEDKKRALEETIRQASQELEALIKRAVKEESEKLLGLCFKKTYYPKAIVYKIIEYDYNASIYFGLKVQYWLDENRIDIEIDTHVELDPYWLAEAAEPLSSAGFQAVLEELLRDVLVVRNRSLPLFEK